MPHAYSAAALQDLITNQSMSSLLSKEDIKVVYTSALLTLSSSFCVLKVLTDQITYQNFCQFFELLIKNLAISGKVCEILAISRKINKIW